VALAIAFLTGMPSSWAAPTPPLPAASRALVAAPAIELPSAVCAALPLPAQVACTAAGGLIDLPSPGDLVGKAADSMLRGMTDFVVSGGVWFVEQLGELVLTTTSIDVQAAKFGAHYSLITGIAAMFCVAFLLLQVIGTIVHQDAGRLLRSVARVAIAGVGTFAAIGITGMLIALTDALSAHVMAGMGGDLKQSLGGASSALGAMTASGSTVPLFAVLIAALLTAVAAFAIWVELLLRAAAVYATLLFFPLALAGMVWEGSQRWAGRLAKTLAALIFSKFLIVGILSLAVGGLSAGGEGFTMVMVGVALLGLATFAPFALFKVIGAFDDLVGSSAFHDAKSRGATNTMYHGRSAMQTLRSKSGSAGGAWGVKVAPGGGALAAGAVPLAAGAAAMRTASSAAGRGVAGVTASSGAPTSSGGS
jgi:hypothetical protein